MAALVFPGQHCHIVPSLRNTHEANTVTGHHSYGLSHVIKKAFMQLSVILKTAKACPTNVPSACQILLTNQSLFIYQPPYLVLAALCQRSSPTLVKHSEKYHCIALFCLPLRCCSHSQGRKHPTSSYHRTSLASHCFDELAA